MRYLAATALLGLLLTGCANTRQAGPACTTTDESGTTKPVECPSAADMKGGDAVHEVIKVLNLVDMIRLF